MSSDNFRRFSIRVRRMPLRKTAWAIAGILTLASLTPGPILAQNQKGPFTENQKTGYLGQTSRSAMARNVLNRLKNRSRARGVEGQADRVLLWHEILLDSIAIDHTPDPDTGEVDFVNGGPTRTSRALAMTQITVFDAANAFRNAYNAYNEIEEAPQNASLDAAIAYASFTIQLNLFPDQADRLQMLLESDLEQIDATEESIAAGQIVGESAANAMWISRIDDNSDDAEPDWGEGGRVADGVTTANGNLVNGGTSETYEWEPDPLTPSTSGDFNLALGAYWGAVTPFSLASGDQYRLPPPPEPGSREYLSGYYLVKILGASPDTSGSMSNLYTRFIGNYWGYDATPLLGTPPRLYNQIAAQVAVDEGIDDPVAMARYLAMINTGLADSGIAAWDSKFYYNYWRPVTGTRKSDDVLMTISDPTWKPVGISVINTELAITPTPPFPAYPSGHATFGSSTFEIMRQFFGNRTRFTFISDEYNGEGVDPLGVPRPLVPIRFQSLDEAQWSNGISRIFNGVHWQWDNLGGQELGENIGRHIVFEEQAFQPVRRGNRDEKGRR
ncbi:vanadium-dependent haloperoxidase [Mariniblastus fucicola]|uniref:PAP2 superfamily protein n=1 Tax=Mariniblastus fucicola TaxID=980251 RepID=A0A5B9P2D6_9BACT|nr:vanadium-dependent haloperoxidase [Mariniblastus fucicola]QEG20677.1 PAP2 superfamily protein [Mariniblastus fucicola]